MSNTNTSSVEFAAVPYGEVPPEVPAQTEPTVENAPAPKKKNAATRIFGLLLAAICVAVIFLPVQVLQGTAPVQTTLLSALQDVFGGKHSSMVFGLLPVLTDATNVEGLLAGVAFYVLLCAIVLTVIFGLIALISGKTCTLRTASYFFATGFGTYAVCGYVFPTIAATSIGLDFVSLGVAAAGAVLYLVLAFAKSGKKALVSLLQLVLSLVVVSAFVIILKTYETNLNDYAGQLNSDFDTFAFLLVIIASVLIYLGALRLQTKKGLALDAVRYVIFLVLSAFLCFISIVCNNTPFMIYAIVAIVVSLLQLVICVAQKNGCKSRAKKEKKVEEPQPEPVPEYTVEEYAEAMPYEGGPVEGVEVAQEVNPTFEENEVPVQVNTAGYDFYNCKSFDPFIAILNTEERNQFTEIFILKYKGVMPEIPDYQVGGDNKEFFRKIFIYLGQYRDRVPDGLLAKIYQFAIKM